MNVTIKWDGDVFAELLRSPEIEARLSAEVERVIARAGGREAGYEGGVEDGRTRSRGYVVTTTVEAIRREASSHTLLRALGSGS